MMRQGEVYIIDDYYVLIEEGSYLRGGRVSNHYSGRYVNEDGTLSDERWHGYGRDAYKKVKCDIVKTVRFK